MGYERDDPSKPLRFAPPNRPTKRTEKRAEDRAEDRAIRRPEGRQNADGQRVASRSRSTTASGQASRQASRQVPPRQTKQPLRQKSRTTQLSSGFVQHMGHRNAETATSLHLAATPGPITQLLGGRTGVITLVAMISVAALALRTTQLQVLVDAAAIAREEHLTLAPQRGDLLDRSGLPFATNEQVANVYIDSKSVTKELGRLTGKQKASLDAKLSRVQSTLGISPDTFAAKLATDSHWVSIGQKIDALTAQQLRDISLYLLTIEDQPRRIYPDASIARGIVGRAQAISSPAGKLRWANLSGTSGLELDLDAALAGKPGELLTERGPGGREIPSENRRLIPATKGTSFYLTLDRALQFRTDEILKEALITYGAKAGYIGVMDTGTGDILASSAQEVDIETGEVKQKLFNVGIGEAYEPGSTMKPFTMATALDTGVVEDEDRFNIEDRLTMQWTRNGKVVDRKTFKDDTSHEPKYWNIHDMLVNSSNIGTITVAKKLKKEGLYEGLKKFGFGEYTNLASRKIETRGVMKDTKDWSGVDIGTVAIGQGISVTPVQLLAAFNSLAAGGEYISPRFVQSELHPNGQRVNRPINKRRVVSSETASTLRSYLQDVVTAGTGKRAYVDGYAVAGKTGTAQKAEKGTYAEKAYIASFGGFFPAHDPEITMIVILDEPWAEYGGMTAAPVFADMVRLTAQRYRIAPMSDEGTAQLSTQVLATPELRAVNDPTSRGVVPPQEKTEKVKKALDQPPMPPLGPEKLPAVAGKKKTASTTLWVESLGQSKPADSEPKLLPKRGRKTSPTPDVTVLEVVETSRNSVTNPNDKTSPNDKTRKVVVGDSQPEPEEKVATKSDIVTGVGQ